MNEHTIQELIELRFRQQEGDGWKVLGEIYKNITTKTLKEYALSLPLPKKSHNELVSPYKIAHELLKT